MSNLNLGEIEIKRTIFKPLHYWPIYQELFEKINKSHDKKETLKIFEIGIADGGSIEMWYKICKQLGIDVSITAIDVRLSDKLRNNIQQVTTNDGSVLLEPCNSNSIEHINAILGDNKFDLIIDDGSHQSDDITKSFHNLFIDRLKDGGIYIIEDLHSHYWQKQAEASDSASNLIRALMDAQNFWSLTKGVARYKVAERYFDKINKIETYDSIVLIHKGKTYRDRSQYEKLGAAEDRYCYLGCPIGSPDGSIIRYGRVSNNLNSQIKLKTALTEEYSLLFDRGVSKDEY